MYDVGVKVVGILDVYGGFYNLDGFDIFYLFDKWDSFGMVINLFIDVIMNEELFEKDCDILVFVVIVN